MSINLIDVAKNALSGGVLDQLGGVIGASSEATARGVGAALPAILGGLLKTSSAPSGVANLVSTLSTGNHASLIGNVASTLGGGSATDNLLKSGSELLSSLLGDRAGAVSDLVGSNSGLNRTASTSLLGALTPLLLGYIARHLNTTGGITPASLTTLLQSQRSAIAAAAPAGLSSALGLASIDDARPLAPAMPAAPAGMGWLKWVIATAVLIAAIMGYRSCQNSSLEVPPAAIAPVPAAPAPAPAPATASDGLVGVTLPDGTVLRAAADGVEGKLLAFITDAGKPAGKTTWFTLDRLDFETGSATLQSTSNAQLDNLAAILKGFPKVKLKLGGYTDNTGNAAANLQLSNDRAVAALNALAARGIDVSRLGAEGYGEQFPVADNATAEGRARNRRTDVRVTAK